MNRKSVIVMTIVAALGIFAVGAFLYAPTPEKTATAPLPYLSLAAFAAIILLLTIPYRRKI